MRSKLPYIILALLFVGYLLLELLGPQPENWSPSYQRDKMHPFGSHLVFESLPDIFPGSKITEVGHSPTKVLREYEKSKSNYIIIQDEFKTDQFEARALIDFVKRGNNVFIAASVFSGSLADSLGIENENEFWDLFEKVPATGDYLQFDEAYDKDQKHFPLLDNVVYSSVPVTGKGVVLGTNKQGRTSYLRVDRGEGGFFIHSVPLMFTNYFMVDPVNHQYISKALSFLPNRDVIWDEYFKPGKVRTDSPVKYLLEQKSLKWAWFVLLGGILLFVVFEAKRRQRTIPVIEPPSNTTLEFTQTVGRLYFEHGDHKDIADKKIKFFLEYIRNRWSLPTMEFTAEFKERLSGKSGVRMTEIDKLFQLIAAIQMTDKVEETALIRLSQEIDDFYNKSK